MAVMKAAGYINAELDSFCFIGELSLNGDLRPVNGVLPMVLLAKEEGMKGVFVPSENAFEASVADGIDIYGVSDIKELIEHFTSSRRIKKSGKFKLPSGTKALLWILLMLRASERPRPLFEIAAAGGHNAL